MSLEVKSHSRIVRSTSDAVDRVIELVGKDLVVGTPLGIGKPITLLNDLYRRAVADPALQIHLITALSPEPPHAGSELERRLLEPILDRLYGSWTGAAWVSDQKKGALPDNVRISEFYLHPGALTDVDEAQRWHINSNYSDVARDCLHHGINVIAQALAVDGSGRYSLSSNPDVTLELLPHFDLTNRTTAFVGVVNRRLPFVGGDAIVSEDQVDIVVDDPAAYSDPFAIPAEPLSLVHHAIGIQAAALIPDGGTIQLGIGSLADAVASALILRHTDPHGFRRSLKATGALDRHSVLIEQIGGTDSFETGLYACSEMLSDSLMALYDHGILRRRAYPDEAVQRMVDSGSLSTDVTPATLLTLRRARVVGPRLTGDDLALLRAIGLVGGGCRMKDESTVELPDGSTKPADLDNTETVDALVASAPGSHLSGPVIHAAFFLGSTRLYSRLRRLEHGGAEDLNMTAVGFTNTVDQAFEVKASQRRLARFVNQAMKVTAAGDVASHMLGDGRTLSGVGGQFDFVDMARRLPGARALILLPATHRRGGRVESNIVGNHGHVTVPAQHRDLVITEYGIADLRSRADGEVIQELIGIADARSRDELVRHGKRTGRLPPSYQPPIRTKDNTSEGLTMRLEPIRDEGLLPKFPFGSDLTEVEVELTRALRSLDTIMPPHRQDFPRPKALRAGWKIPDTADPYLRRMGLEQPSGLKESLLQRALAIGLSSAEII